MSNPPWMPLFVDDYLSDTQHLNAAQHGAYFLLILHFWKKGKLPNDEAQLAMIAKMSPREWARHRPILAALFGSNWSHKRIEKELLKAASKAEVRAQAGKLGGEAKALKNNQSSLAKASILPKQKAADSLASSPYPESPSENLEEATASSSSTAPKMNGNGHDLFGNEKPVRKKRITAEGDLKLLDRIADLWNPWAAQRGLAQIEGLTDQRGASLRRRLEYLSELGYATPEKAFGAILAKAERSFFIRGSPRSPLKFDQLLRESFLVKLLEGQFEFEGGSNGKGQKTWVGSGSSF